MNEDSPLRSSLWNNSGVVNSYADATNNPEKNWYEDQVNTPALASLIPKNTERVLDFGCGPGKLAAELSKYFDVLGVDGSDAMVNKAIEKYPEIKFLMWDGMKPFEHDEEKAFDAIISKLTLEFIEDLPTVANHLYDTVKIGGVLIISVQHPLLAIAMHPEGAIPYWGATEFDVDIGSTGLTVTKIHRNLNEYIEPFINAGFTLLKVDEPQIPHDIAKKYHARPLDLQFPKRLNILFRRN